MNKFNSYLETYISRTGLLGILLFCINFGQLANGQVLEYTLVKSMGDSVFNISRKEVIGSGKSFGSTDLLRFGSQKSKLLTVGKTGSRYIFKPNPELVAKNTGMEFKASEVVVPMPDAILSASKGKSATIDNLKDEFTDSTYVIPGDNLKLRLTEAVYPLGTDCAVVISFIGKSGKNNRVQVHTNSDTLLFTRAQFLESGEWTNGQKVKLYSFTPSTKQSVLIRELKLWFVPNSELKPMVIILKKQGGKSTPSASAISENLRQFIFASYGYISPSNLEKWMASNPE